MQAAQYNENSDSVDVVKVVSVDKPSASPGFAVVKVVAAAANPIDLKVLGGHLKGAGWSMDFPFTMGYDFAGVVDSVDASDSAFSVGDEVFGVNWGQHKHDETGHPVGGAFAEYILVPVSKLSKKPSAISFDQAAAVALVGTTAYQILFDCAKVASGSRVLILGGSTAVGSLAIQLAKSRGAWVATTCSSRTLDYVSQFGPDKVVNYREANWENDTELRELDAVIDTVGENEGFSKTKDNNVVKATGSFVSISAFDAGFDPNGHPPLSFAAFYCLRNDTSHQNELASMVANGTLNVNIDKRFPFTEAGVRELLTYQMSGASCGKNILYFDK
mmetsp:Transcript_13570/g.20366  ORF Transcript_13570/g.20366 Transcript_13570/m.20366 type:complete len:331 (+) Transcript_13570:136-1128(+)